jgi:hypothetical protein
LSPSIRQALESIREILAGSGSIDVIGGDPNGTEGAILDRGKCEEESVERLVCLLRLRRWDLAIVQPVGSTARFAWGPNPLVACAAAEVPILTGPSESEDDLFIDGIHIRCVEDVSSAACWHGEILALVGAPGRRRFLSIGALRLVEAMRETDPLTSSLHQLAWRLRAGRRLLPTSTLPPRLDAPLDSEAPCEATPHEGVTSGAPVPVRLFGILRYRFEARHAGWAGLDVMIGTHRSRPGGFLRLRVTTGADRPLRESSIDLSRVRDNSWACFRFDPVEDSRGRAYRVEIDRTPPRGGGVVSVYEGAGPGTRRDRLRRMLDQVLIRSRPEGRLHGRARYR